MTDKIIEIKNDDKSIALVTEAAMDIVRHHNLSDACGYALAVVFDELLSNIMHYAYGDKNKHSIKVTLSVSGRNFKAVIEDDGIAFNPLDTPDIDTTLSLQERGIGGVGIYLVKKMVDKVGYKRKGNKNIVTLFKTDG